MRNPVLHQRAGPDWTGRLTLFFELIRERGDDRFFHPHPFTGDQAETICNYRGRDLYFIQGLEERITGYGMLRGWEDGFDVPSLGLIIHPDFRGKGLAAPFMRFLHEQAGQKGARRIRLKVYPENKTAISLYRKLGYDFKETENHQLVGGVTL